MNRDLLDFNNIKIHCQETNLIALQWHAGQIVSCLWHIFLVSPSHLSNPQPRIWGLSPSTQHQPSNRWQKTEIIWRGLLVTWKSMWCWHQTSLGWHVYKKKNILSQNLKHFDISELHVLVFYAWVLTWALVKGNYGKLALTKVNAFKSMFIITLLQFIFLVKSLFLFL